jgi:hypothetical protein
MKIINTCCCIVAVILLLCNQAMCEESKKSYYMLWNKMNGVNKSLFFNGVLTGIHAMSIYAGIKYEDMDYLQNFIEYKECVEKDFNVIYSQHIDIEPHNLFLLSLDKCAGKITSIQFLGRLENLKK